MSNINVMRKNLGPVTAYKYAVQQGYIGTEQEFAALMASYATVAEEAESARDDAIDAKTAAEEAQAAAEAAAEQAEGAIEVDDTLSVTGRAADAKKTGDKITSLKDQLNNLAEITTDIIDNQHSLSSLNPTEWSGYILKADGTTLEVSTNHIYYFKPSENIKFYIGTNNFSMRFCVYRNGSADESTHSFSGTFENYSEDVSTRPSENDPIDVTTNDIVAISCPAYYRKSNISIGYYVNKKVGAVMLGVKTANDTFSLFVPSEKLTTTAEYQFIKYEKQWDSLTYQDAGGNTQTALNVKSADCWNNLHIMKDGIEIVSGNTNFICKVLGESGHAGDGHGNEVSLYTAFIADGNEIDIDALSIGDTFKCSVFKFIQRSNVYSVGGGNNTYSTAYPALDTSGNPIVNFQHNMEVTYNIGNVVTIDNKLIVKRNGIRFEQCHGAMLECFYGMFDTVYCNNAEGTRNEIDSSGVISLPVDSTVNLSSNPSQKCDVVEMYGGDFYVRQEMHQEKNIRADKSNVVFHFFNNRLKAYFQPVIAYFGNESETDPIETFNAGDYISIIDKRFVEI